MAYEKYIKKDGKIYGPYIYHSRRVDGKVISEYHGQKKLDAWKFLPVIFIVILIIFWAYLIGQKGKTTGYSVLDLNANYEEGKPLAGEIKLSLQEGELIPSSSTVVFENAGNKYEYPLKELISEQSIEGNFFVNGKTLSGSGSGFGTPGIREIYPEVDFVLLVYSKVNETENTESEIEVSGTVSTGNNFTYTLQEDERVEIKPRSVKLKLDSSQLNEDDITLAIEGNLVSISTNYSEKEGGFGADFTGEKIKELTINLNDLNLLLEPGQLKVGIFYKNEEIVSVETEVSGTDISGESEIIIPETGTQTETQNQGSAPLETQSEASPILNETSNETITEIPVQELQLTQEETAILLREFGNISLEVIETKEKNGFLIVRYELGDYWINYSYSSDLDDITLNAFMEADKVKWLKDLAKIF